MKSLWKVKGFEKRTSWKVMRFSRENEQKSDADMYINNVEFSACRTTHTPHSNTTQQHSTAQPFTRACLQFLTTLTCRALYGKSHCHGQSCRLPALVFDHFDFQNTARESHCVNTICDHRKKTKKKTFVLYFLYLPDTLKHFKT